MQFKYRWWGKGDLDASIGIFFDGFSKILSATGIMLLVFGMPADIVLGKIVPGVGLAIFAGNLWYFYEAWALARQERRQDVTAQPFGIGASQLTGWLYLIMGPVYWQTGDAELAFQVGLAASLIGGMIEVLGGFIGRWIVKVVPHSALMGNMASSALVWLSFVGIAMVFDKPVYALLPFCMVIIDYLGKADRRFQKLPTGVIAVVLGAVIAWSCGYLTWDNFTASFQDLGFYPPTFCGGDILQGIRGIVPFLPVIIPLQINNFLSTLQGIEAAKAVGDSYPERRSMVMDGCSTMLGSLFGNPLAVGLYWGYPGWKKMGSGTGYHLGIVGLYALVGLTGLSAIITAFIPEAVVLPILVFVGISSYSQAFEVVSKKYYPAVIMASMPVVMDFIMDNVAEGKLEGFWAFDPGSAFVGLLVGCVFVFIIDNAWLKAAVTNVVALGLTGIGMIHSQGLLFTGTYAPDLGFVAAYCVLAAAFLVMHFIKFNQKAHQADLEAEKAAALEAAKNQ